MIEYRAGKRIARDELAALYKSVRWQHYLAPDKLEAAYDNSDFVVSAWDGDRLVGVGRAITDGHFNVFFPDMLVDPDYRGQGVGHTIVAMMLEKYSGLYNITAVAEDPSGERFLESCGLTEKKAAFRRITPLAP